MSYLDAAKLILEPLLDDSRLANVFGPDGTYFDATAIERAETLSTGERALVAFAQAIYTQTPTAGSSIVELGKLDRDSRARVLRSVATFYDIGIWP